MAVAITAIGVAAVAAFRAASTLADEMEQIQRQATRTGVGANQLQIMSRIIEEGGGNAAGLTQQLTFLNRAIGNQNPMLAKLGITTKDTGQAYLQLMRALASSRDVGLQTVVAMELLGRAGSDVIADAKAITADYERMAKAIEAAGLAITPGLLEAANKLDKQTDDLKLRWDGMIRTFQTGLLPVAQLTAELAKMSIELVRMTPGLIALEAWAARIREAKAEDAKVVPLSAHQVAAATAALKDQLAVLGGIKEVQDHLRLAPPGAVAGAAAEVDVLAGRETGGEKSQRAFMERTTALLRAQMKIQGQVKEQSLQLFAEVNEFALAASQGIVRGIDSVFQGFLDKSQTIGSVVTTLWRSIASAILSELARIAAAQALLFLGSLIPGPIGVALRIAGGAPRMSVPSAGGLAPIGAGAGGNTYNIRAISARDVLQDLTSTGGSFRRANDRLIELGGA